MPSHLPSASRPYLYAEVRLTLTRVADGVRFETVVRDYGINNRADLKAKVAEIIADLYPEDAEEAS